jgi:alcohol dehydrogenase class IV
MIKPFNIAKLPELYFGVGKISRLAEITKSFGSRAVLITGSRSFLSSDIGRRMLEDLSGAGISVDHYKIDQEPSPAMVDAIVKDSATPDVVIAIGGGSVLDAGKAIAAMIPLREPVIDFLEGVGTKSHAGLKVPFIAVPTTSGTGSEATKNAVLSESGPNGFKKSLRHNNFVPDIAIVDPALTRSCPGHVTAASGMDAFTQLLESYLSTTANPVTDSLATEGLKCISRSLLKSFCDPENISARTDMALAAYLSGVTLANAGLGLVHGFAGVIGGWHDISHGQICSALMPSANALTVKKLRQLSLHESLHKYTLAGKIFSSEQGKSDDYYIDMFIELQFQWKEELKIPKLTGLLSEKQLARIAEEADNKNNPVELNADERFQVLSTS